MSLEEIKQKAIDLIGKLDDKEEMEKVFLFLAKSGKQFTADEVFEKTVSKFDTTLQKLAN